MAYAKMILGFAPIKTLIDDYLSLDDKARLRFIRRHYEAIKGSNVDVA
jgi:conjugal transfer ATP-binding protein TraC